MLNKLSKKAIALLKEGKDVEAEKLLQNNIERHPKDALLYALVGFLAQFQKDFDKMSDAHDRACRLNPDYRDVGSPDGRALKKLFEEIILERSRDLVKVSSAFQEVLKDVRKQIELNQIDLKEIWSSPVVKRILAASRTSVPDLEPASPEGLTEQAIRYRGQGDLQKAAESYLKALEKNPNHILAVLGMGGLYYAKGEYQKALDYFQKAYGITPESHTAYMIAQVFLKKGENDQAAEHFQKVKKYSGNYGDASRFLIAYWFRNHHYDRVIDCYLEFIEVLRDEGSTTWDAFYIYEHDPRMAAWMPALVKQFLAETGFFEDSFADALFQVVRGRIKESEKKLKAILKKDADHLLSLKLLAGIYSLKGGRASDKAHALLEHMDSLKREH